jgi:hypothetical protein
MKKIHVAISVSDIAKSISDYNLRIGEVPCVVVPGEYALWRTESINFSIRKDVRVGGSLRHLGVEDDSAKKFSEEKDLNGISWETFSEKQQDDEIIYYWPHAEFKKRK